MHFGQNYQQQRKKEDELLSSSGPGHPVTKYMRTWEIYEWSICGNAEPIRTVVQMIDVSDQRTYNYRYA